MISMKVIVWLFPILFMLHDFEEIILVEAWKNRNKNKLELRGSQKLVFAGCKNTPSFSIGVAIEFVLFSLVSFYSVFYSSYTIWYGLFFGFTIHSFGHIGVVLQYKFYVPGIATSILFIPCSIFILYIASQLLSLSLFEFLLNCTIGIFAMLLIIVALHKSMKMFELWIEKYSNKCFE